jgi:RimJ/RimL family protein N-acetyltransferase
LSELVQNGDARRAPLPGTRHVRIRTITERDSGFIYQLMTSDRSGGRVRFGGATPSPQQVSSSLWESVLAQFVVEGVQSGRPLGLTAITTPNFRDGFAYFSALASDDAQGHGLMFEGVFLTFEYAFATWPFRKIYLEATEESYKTFYSGLDRFFTEEGRLKQHTFWNGRYMDLAVFAVYRDKWELFSPAIRERLKTRNGSSETCLTSLLNGIQRPPKTDGER